MRALVGSTDRALFDNPSGGPVFPGMAPEDFPTILDFGCGCGRLARQFLQQQPRPERYVGLDLHAGMINWCSQNLAPLAQGFEFHHHDVLYGAFNPGADKPLHRPLALGRRNVLARRRDLGLHSPHPGPDRGLSLRAGGRVSAPTGTLLIVVVPLRQARLPDDAGEQNTLFINEMDVRNAVIYDWTWLRNAVAERGMVVTGAAPPEVRGHQWVLSMRHAGPGASEVELPDDIAERGRRPPPAMPADAARLGHATAAK